MCGAFSVHASQISINLFNLLVNVKVQTVKSFSSYKFDFSVYNSVVREGLLSLRVIITVSNMEQWALENCIMKI